jgi:hypothetical protein
VNLRLEDVNLRLEDVNLRLEDVNLRLEGNTAEIVRLREDMRDGHVRLATEVIAVADAMREVRDLLAQRLDDRDRLEDHETRLARLEKKVG